jgi:hypothetical protein
MRRVIAAAFVLCLTAFASSAACAQIGGWQDAWSDAGDYQPDFGDPSSAMRIRIEQVADHGSGHGSKWAFTPCTLADAPRASALCWSSYGRNLHMVLPKLALNAVSVLRPHTIYSYQAFDLRFPPAVRVHMPFNATTTVGYEYDNDELFGVHLRLNF